MIDAYHNWLLENYGTGSKMNGGEGKAMNEIIVYLGQQEKIAGDEQKILEAWQFILSHWKSLDTFHQKNLKLCQINSSLINIIASLRNNARNQIDESRDPARLSESISRYVSNGAQ